MRLSSLSAALFAAFAWTTQAAQDEQVKSVSVRTDSSQCLLCFVPRLTLQFTAQDTYSDPGSSPKEAERRTDAIPVHTADTYLDSPTLTLICRVAGSNSEEIPSFAPTRT